MAQVVVDSQVMRDKAVQIEKSAEKLLSLYEEMLSNVTTTANKMKGTTIDTEKQKFESMRVHFETFTNDIKSYAKFLNAAAEAYDAVETQGTQEAEQQGKIF